MGVEPTTYAVQSEHATAPLSHKSNQPGGNFRSFNLHGEEKRCKK